MKLLDQAKTILHCTQSKDVILFARLAKIGLAPTCGRCGGTGEFSYNAVDGTKCFGCNGRGWLVPKVTRKLVVELKELEINGAVQEYLDDLSERLEYDKWIKANGSTKLLEMWIECGIANYYEWNKLNPEFPKSYVAEYVPIAAINRKMHDAHEHASKAELQRLKATLGKVEYTKEQLICDLKHAETMMEAALFEWQEYLNEVKPMKVR